MKIPIAAVAIRLIATALLAAAVAPLHAQEEQLVVSVPFDFVVGVEHLSAGKYVVRPASEDPSIMWIERMDGREAAVTMTIPGGGPSASPSRPGLVFETRDNQRVLAKLVEADGTAREIVPASDTTGERSAAAGAR